MGDLINYAHFEVGGDERSQRSSIWKSAIVRENCGGVEYYRMHKLQGPGNCAGSEKRVETDELVVIHVGCYVFVEFHEQQNFSRHFIHFRISKHQTVVPEIIFKPMSNKNGVGIDEPHQIILHLLQVLCRAIF